MPIRLSREVTVAVSGLALVVALSLTAAILSPPAVEGLAPGSSVSAEPDGSAAAYATLQSLGYQVNRSFEAMATLRTEPTSTVLLLADPKEPASNGDRRALQSFVAAGGTALITGCSGASFLAALHAAGVGRAIDERSFTAGFPSPLSAGAPRISMEAGCLWSDAAARYTVLYGDDRGAAVRFARIGTGLVVWWAGNAPIANRAIDGPGHLDLLLNVVGPPGRTILWDEFYHGQRRSLYSYARLTPLPWLLAQTLLIAIVAAAMYARRRAPVLDRFVQTRTSPLEFVDTMAGLYARAGTAGDAVATARARLRRLLLEATGLASSVDDQRLAAAAAGRLRIDESELDAALRRSGSPDMDGHVTAHEALPLVRRLQTVAAALDRRGG